MNGRKGRGRGAGVFGCECLWERLGGLCGGLGEEEKGGKPLGIGGSFEWGLFRR